MSRTANRRAVWRTRAAFAAMTAMACLAWPLSAATQTPGLAPKGAKKPYAVAITSVDAELLLRSCAGEAHHNAKLYVARAHGIDLMKLSADRNQGRSMLRIEAQLEGTLNRLRGKGGSVDADLDRMEEALIGLTELTLQQPQVAQVETALRLAERAAVACVAAVGKLGYDTAAAPSQARLRPLAAMSATSQQLAGAFLAASLRPGGPSATEAAALAKLATAFDAELGRLRPAGSDDAALRDMLALLDGQWLFVRQALTRPRDNARAKIEDVGRASELLFELIDTELRRQQRRALS